MRKTVPRDTTFEEILDDYYRTFGYLPTSFTYGGEGESFDHQTRYGKVRIEFSKNIPDDEVRIRLKDDWTWTDGKWHCSRFDRNWDVFYEEDDGEDTV